MVPSFKKINADVINIVNICSWRKGMAKEIIRVKAACRVDVLDSDVQKGYGYPVEITFDFESPNLGSFTDVRKYYTEWSKTRIAYGPTRYKSVGGAVTLTCNIDSTRVDKRRLRWAIIDGIGCPVSASVEFPIQLVITEAGPRFEIVDTKLIPLMQRFENPCVDNWRAFIQLLQFWR